MKRLYVAATNENVGKTTTCLGLISALRARKLNVAFMKPVGQHWTAIDGPLHECLKVDEDVALMRSVFALAQNPADMSPVIIDRGFTRRHLDGQAPEDLEQRILDAADRLSRGVDVLLVEGTGHAGVGSIVGVSNAHVAKLIDAPVLLLAQGGIGRPVDSVALNLAVFESHRVRVIGTILNRVRPDKVDSVYPYARRALERLGVRALGYLPERPALEYPTIRQIIEKYDGTLLSDTTDLDVVISGVVVTTAYAYDALDQFRPGSLVITNGNREDIILAAMGSVAMARHRRDAIAGILLTRGALPHPTIRDLVAKANVPLISVKHSAFAVATQIHDVKVKTAAADRQKIKVAQEMLEQYIDVDALLELI